MPALRASSRFSTQVPALQDLLPPTGPVGRDSRSDSRPVGDAVPAASAGGCGRRRKKNLMSVTYPIADLLTRIRNALAVGHDAVQIPHSKLKAEVVKILHQQGYIFRLHERRRAAVRVPDGPPQVRSRQYARDPGPALCQHSGTPHIRGQERDPAGAGRSGHQHSFHVAGNRDREESQGVGYRRRVAL